MTRALVSRSSNARADDATRIAFEAAHRHPDVYAWGEAVMVGQEHDSQLVVTSAGTFVVVSVAEEVQREDLELVRRSVACIRAVLLKQGYDVPVRALVAVWDDAAAGLPSGGTEIDRTLVLRGTELAAFLGWSAEAGTVWTRARALRALLSLDIRIR